MFHPVPQHPSVVDSCADALRQAILGGELAAGTRLPPERELAERFGVNRVTVRSALGRLGAERLVEARQGSGTTVRDFREEAGPAVLPGLAVLAEAKGDLPEVAADLLLVRRQLARAVVERLAEGVDGDALAAIEAAVDSFAATVAEGADTRALAGADAVVVRAIVDATGSAVLRLCLNPIGAVLRTLPALRDAIYADASASVVAFRAVLAWLRAPDTSGIAALLEAMAARDAMTLARLEASS